MFVLTHHERDPLRMEGGTTFTLRRGERIFDGVGGLHMDSVSVVASPTVTHLRYRLGR